jgi:hypothetical protein
VLYLELITRAGRLSPYEAGSVTDDRRRTDPPGWPAALFQHIAVGANLHTKTAVIEYSSRPKRLRCPRCEHPVHTRIHHPIEGPYVTFGCPESYMTDKGRRRCGRPVVLTHLDGRTVAMFPVRWADIAGMSLENMLDSLKVWEVPGGSE